MDRFEKLLSAYLDGALNAPGREDLQRLVEADPERLRLLTDLVRQNRILSVELDTDTGEAFTLRVLQSIDRNNSQFIRAVMSDVRSSGKHDGPGFVRGVRQPLRTRMFVPPQGRQGFPRLSWGVFAAGVVLAVAVVLVTPGPNRDRSRLDMPPRHEEAKIKPAHPAPAPPVPKGELPLVLTTPPTPAEPPSASKPIPATPENPPDEPKPLLPAPPVPVRPPEERATIAQVALIDSVEGEVWAVSQLGKVRVAAGSPLLPGFAIETTNDESTALVLYPDGTRMELRGTARVSDLTDRQGRRIRVEGVLFAEVARQPADQPMVFVTVQAEVKVLGTRLMLEAGPETTQLNVSEGRVQMTRLKDKATVAVETGHYAVAASGIPLVSRLARTTKGLLALYTFREGRGAVIRDISRTGNALDLRIENPGAARWSPKGLTVVAATLVASEQPAAKIVQRCRSSNEVTIELWVRPATLTPASKDGRILTLSADPLNQDFMIGQDDLNGPARAYFVRLRTTVTDGVGKPALVGLETVAPKLTHVVYTRTADGTAVLAVDGMERSRATVEGNLSVWDGAYRLALGNELTRDRPWLGEYRLVALYDRALAADEVKHNFRAGAD